MELRLSELVTDCPTCGGTGHLPAPAAGNGLPSDHPGSSDCPDCEVRGGRLTARGKALVAFLERLKAPGG